MQSHTEQSGQLGLLEGPDWSRLSHQEREVFKELMGRPGRASAITGRELGRLFGMSMSEVRETVHNLRVAAGAPIGSGSSGYFWIVDPEEARATAAHFKSRIREMARVISVLEGRTLAEVAGQLRMDLIADGVTSPPKDTGKRPDWGVDGGDNAVEDLDGPEE